MTETSHKQLQIKTSFSYSSSLNNVSSESPKQKQILQSPLSYAPREDNISPSSTNKRPTFSSMFSFTRTNSRIKRYRSEIYQEKDEYTNGCFGYFRTSGSKIKYKVNNVWKYIKINCKRRFSKKKNSIVNMRTLVGQL
jgi:hypothetical protein